MPGAPNPNPNPSPNPCPSPNPDPSSNPSPSEASSSNRRRSPSAAEWPASRCNLSSRRRHTQAAAPPPAPPSAPPSATPAVLLAAVPAAKAARSAWVGAACSCASMVGTARWCGTEGAGCSEAGEPKSAACCAAAPPPQQRSTASMPPSSASTTGAPAALIALSCVWHTASSGYRTGAASGSCTSTASPWLRTAPIRNPPSRLATATMGCPAAVAAADDGRPIFRRLGKARQGQSFAGGGQTCRQACETLVRLGDIPKKTDRRSATKTEVLPAGCLTGGAS